MFHAVVADAFVGGLGGEGVDRFHRLQDRLLAQRGEASPY
jgi:hypothetical protein